MGSAFKISNFIGSNPGDLPPGGGVVSVIVDGDLIVDVDYSFAPGSHVLLTDGSSISVDDELAVPNLDSPKLIFDGTTISSCGNDRWSFIRALDEFSEISFINGTIVNQGISGIFIGENAMLTATNSTFSGIAISCITLGSASNPYNQNIDATIVNNVFEFCHFGIRAFHTVPISIGTGNIFRFPVSASANLGFPSAIQCSSTSSSIASGNEIIGFPRGIWSNNRSADFRYLSCSGIEISDCGIGIDVKANNDGISVPQDGVSLYLRSSILKNNDQDIEAYVQKGNSYLIFDNQFLNQGNALTSVAIRGTIPRFIRFQNNIIDRPTGTGFKLSLPIWDAGASGLSVQNNDITTNIDGIGLSLFRGGNIGDNIVNCSGNTAIEIINCDGAYIYDNEVSATGIGDGQFSGSIYLENSVNCILECNQTDGMGNGGGISFFEHCDNSIILRNTMSNHVRGLTSLALKGDPIIGQQPYRDNTWLGGSTAEAALETFGGIVNPIFFQFNRFTVQNNTGQIWPNSIIPVQDPLGGNSLEWFWVNPSPSNPPQACFDTPIEDPMVFRNLTLFEEGLMDGLVNPPLGSSGKYRDIDFQVFSKLKSDSLPLDINSYAYYESLNSSYFNDRYSLQEHIILASDASATLDIEEESQLLLENLELLASIDDGTQESLRDSTLESVQSLSSLISGSVLSYQSGMEERLSNIQLLLQGMSGTAPADSAFIEVANVYFNNFGTVYEQYSQADQSVIDYYAGLCVLEYGEAVYLANAIAGTVFNYDLISACRPKNAYFQAPDKIQAKKSFRAYPSPTRGEINIHYPFEEFKSMKVYNAIGKVILEFEIHQQTINLNGEAPGIYFVELINQNNERYVQKVILQ